ncbi:MAG: (4Fe-4S)-binding protein [Bacteroidetes bacterium]|nr:(4Fe-4S)-binding protein [Bacteroidota bacterium]
MQYQLEQPVHGTIEKAHYHCTIQWRSGTLIADEPVKGGGADTGPDPYTLLLSSLASCTLITLRMYIDRKGWEIPQVTVNANLFQSKQGEAITTFIDRDIDFPGAQLEPEQRNRLSEIAQACPISKILQGEIKVRTFVYHNEDVEKKIKYSNDDITVVWKPELCKHSGRCVTQLPKVFDLKAHPWVNINGADKQAIIDQVAKCPTGALSVQVKNEPVF